MRNGVDVFPVFAYGSVLAAANAAHNAGGGTVLITPGEWTTGTTRVGSFYALLPVYPNVRYEGLGYDCVVKLPNDTTTAGEYRIFAPFDSGAADTDNVSFTNFRIDGNAGNNIVLGTTGGDIRYAFGIQVARGRNIRVQHMWFENMAGRNVIVIDGTNPATIRCKDVWITDNHLRNLGGANVGNHLQNDHSAIYSQADGAHILRNEIWAADAVWDPDATASRIVAAYEVHGSRNDVSGNKAWYCTTGANIVAAVAENRGTRFTKNEYWNCTKQGIQLVSMFPLRDLQIDGDLIHLHTSYNGAVAGIYQSTSAINTIYPVENLKIDDVDILNDDLTARSTTVPGVQLCAVDGGRVRGCRIRNMPGGGINVANGSHASATVSNLSIAENDIKNVGLYSGSSDIFAIHILNDHATKVMRGVWVSRNAIHKDEPSGQMRGVRFSGGAASGVIEESGTVDNRYRNIRDITTWESTLNATNFRRVSFPPRRFFSTSGGADPTSGMYLRGDQILYTDVTANGFVGKIAVNSAAARGGDWLASTAYPVGAWRRAVVTGKIIECVVAGTSHSSVEPNPTTLGETFTDGSVSWVYRATTSVSWKTFGAISP